MPTFCVHLTQYVEEVAEMIIEAPTEKEARDIALSDSASADWQDGTDTMDVDVYCVKDAAGKIVWERD